MARLTWGNTENRLFETGLDRGVLYIGDNSHVWDGIVSVEESGSSEQTTHYFEGRPFLNNPKPKEFEATINAYSHPAAFAEVMGMPEVYEGNDPLGLYLDSQSGSLFSLSYRTLVGNAIEGLDHGYKIHIVYDATVTSPGGTYATLTSEVNPIEFSWTIKTVPQEIDTARPTAHVVVDSRRVDPERLAEIERILYGSPTSVPRLPTAQELYDILSFGDAIYIDDLGGGYWQARGSHKNVTQNSDGEITIYNVDATHHYNGTFTISSTNV